jgi:hypothetical protein
VGFRAWLDRRRRGVAAAASITTASAVTAAALLYPGFTQTNLDLSDGGVWVTNNGRNAVGRLNFASKTLDGAVVAASPSFDVLQHEKTVIVDDSGASAAQKIDPAEVRLGSLESLPAGVHVALGASSVAIGDPGTGRVWALPESAVPGTDLSQTPPTLEAGKGAVAAIGPTDVVAVAEPESGVVATFQATPSAPQASQDSYTQLKGVRNVQSAVVGDAAVAYDPGAGRLFLPGGKTIDVPGGADGKLQQSSAAGGSVAVATPTGLVLAPLDGGQPTVVPANAKGIPAAPVSVSGCVYAAWAGPGVYVRTCGNDIERKPIPSATPRSEFVFRVNRNLVVLNDIAAGTVWLVTENMYIVNNWDEVIPIQSSTQDADKESPDEVQTTQLPDRTKPNQPPVAKPDHVGVRPGRTTLLPVLDNDSDPDGDLLTVKAQSQPSVGSLEQVYGATGFQITVPPDAHGSTSFTYTADDGRGGTATAPVSIDIVPLDTNRPPQLKPGRNNPMIVGLGKESSRNVLDDWTDPDGDDMFLASATTKDPADKVKFTPQGTLTFTDAGSAPGRKTVTITVSDGRSTTTADIAVEVRAGGKDAPAAVADHVTAIAGIDTKVSPLLNDSDPEGGNLRLALVTPPAGVTSTIDANQQTFTFRSDTAGTYYVEYVVTNGPASAKQLVRVDVVPPDEQGKPVAVRDLAAVPAGGSTLVDVLANDTDPAGGVLVVQSVDAPPQSGLSVSILDHSVVRVTDVRAQDSVTVHYTISNGHDSAVGEISVLVLPPPEKPLPPEAVPDSADVRAGDLVTIPVLANDSDPDGGDLALDHKLVQTPDPADGTMFVSGKTLRFLAGPTAKTVYAIYQVRNTSGQVNSAQVAIRIHARDSGNVPPQPRSLTARVIAGQTVKIPVPLDGIDPDGDSVKLIGLDRGPAQGTAIAGALAFDYTAAPKAAGVDTFTYRVRDRVGAEAVGTVIVGIAPPSAVNHAPQPVDDHLLVRPGRQVAVDVLQNDSDPDGDPLSLVPDGFEGSAALKAEADKHGFADVTSPSTPSVENLRYTVQDPQGARSSATLRVESKADAPLQAPNAVDDFVTTAQAEGHTTAQVPVLANDVDPDGRAEDLKVSLPAGSPAHLGADQTVVVPLTASDQILEYTVTDIDGLTGTAFIWVPGVDLQRPHLAKEDVTEVKAGTSVDFDLKDWVAVRDGRTPRITSVDRVSAVGAAARGLVASDSVLHYAALPDFVGPGSITFEVTDGSGPDDPTGLKSTITLQTKVLPSDANHPPAFQGSTVDVPAGEDARLDLGQLAKDPDPADQGHLAFAVRGAAPDGFTASVDGSTLTVRTRDGVLAGRTGSLTVTVTDGHSDPVAAQFTLTATASNRPLAIANDVLVPDADAGRTERVDVLSHTVNPFPEAPLTIVSAVVEAGQAEGGAQVDGGSVIVTPAKDYRGMLVVRYTVQDKTGDPSRQVDGRIRLTVRGVPDAPGTPTATDIRDQTAVLHWAPAADNGAPILKYTVRGDGFSQDCPATTCTLSGLTNNTVYHFTVTATNDVGESPPSSASPEVRPDARPSAPGAPVAVFGDGKLDISWGAAKSTGSPVTSYNLEISPPPANGAPGKQGVTGTSTTWTGLTNGVQYTVRVQAVNNAPQPSDWSPYSAPVSPAAPPGQPAAPVAQSAPSLGSTAQVSVSWKEPATNGDAISAYYVTMSGGGGADRTQKVAGTSTTATFDAPTSESPYTFTVQAENKAGKGSVSPPSAPRRAVGKLGSVTNVSATPANTGGTGTQLTVNFTPLTASQRNGSAANEVSYTYSASTGQSGPITPGQTVGGFRNGAATTVSVIAHSSTGAADSDPASAPQTRPYGSPGTPSASGQDGATNQRSLTLSWSSPSTSTNDVARTAISIDGGAWENVAASGSRTINTAGYNETHSIRVQTFNSVGTGGGVASASARSGPQQTSWQTQLSGSATRNCTDNGSGQSWYSPTNAPHTCDGVYNGFPWLYPGTTITVNCWSTINTRYGAKDFYHIIAGSYQGQSYAGRWQEDNNVTIGGPAQSGVPHC